MLRRGVHSLTGAMLALLLLGGPATAAEVSDSWSGTYDGTFYDISAAAQFPGEVEPDTDFDITITASCNRIYWYSLREDAEWSYVDEATHILQFSKEGTIHELDWQYRQPFVDTFTFNRPAGTYRFTFYVEGYGAHNSRPGVAVDFEVVVKDSCDFSTEGIDEYIQGLGDGAFKNNGKSRRATLANKLRALQQMIDEGRYDEALDKLQNDIRSKVDGEGKNDWITDGEAQADLLSLIDSLSDCLWEALVSPPG